MAKDMRSWIGQLEEAGELSTVGDEVHVDLDIGRHLFESRDKALLFDNVTDYPGWKVVGQAPANMRQVGLAFGIGPEKVVREFTRRLDTGLTNCKMVDSGPVKDVVLIGSDARLFDLPIHITAEKDPGRFITAGLCVVKDPETGIRNMAFHRLQVKANDKMGILMHPGRHTRLIYEKYEAMNESMPMAIFIGHHLMYYFAASYTGHLGLNELEVAGTLLGEPVELVKCETIDVEVPAYAEMVLECELLPHVREDEGPFCEFTGYYAGKVEKRPIVMLKAITRRHDAIYKALQCGSFTECDIYTLPTAVALFRDLRNVGGYVDLKDVSCTWGTVFNVVIQMTPRFYGEAKHVLLAALSSLYHHQKIAIAVDEDVDIYDPKDVAWAIATRVNPETDVTIIRRVRGHPLDQSLPVVEGVGEEQFQRLGSKMLIDATKPPTCNPAARAGFERAMPPSRK